jgi:hypothetical protein
MFVSQRTLERFGSHFRFRRPLNQLRTIVLIERSCLDELKPKVISVGTLPELLLLREYVLQSVGYDVLSITNLQEAASRIENKAHCGVLLLCYEAPDVCQHGRQEVVLIRITRDIEYACV